MHLPARPAAATPLVAAAAAITWSAVATGGTVQLAWQDLIGLAGIPVIVALVELVKLTFPDLPSRWYPLVALAWGLIVNLSLMPLSGSTPLVGLPEEWRAQGANRPMRIGNPCPVVS